MRLKKITKKSQQGTSLIEAIIATAILALVMTSIVSLTSLTLRNQRMSAAHADAAKLATEGIEWVRSMRDAWGWATFSGAVGSFNGDKTYCLPMGMYGKDQFITNAFSSGTCNSTQLITRNNSTFTRTVTFNTRNTAPPTLYDIEVKVSWGDGARNMSTVQKTTLYKWK